jgi:hypothetical protein
MSQSAISQGFFDTPQDQFISGTAPFAGHVDDLGGQRIAVAKRWDWLWWRSSSRGNKSNPRERASNNKGYPANPDRDHRAPHGDWPTGQRPNKLQDAILGAIKWRAVLAASTLGLRLHAITGLRQVA